nr:hypothetical protein AMTR_s00071p00160380 [Tanacetum cinerariifolium]
MSFRRTNILNRSSTQTTELPTQEDQIRGYRAMTKGRYQAARETRRVFGRNNYNITPKSVVDPERQLELSRERGANLVPAELPKSKDSGLRHIHLGIFMIRLHALHRRSAGTNTLVVLRDTRWEVSRQIIGTMKVDLFAGTQLVYMFSNMVLSIDDFHNHVEVAIQTREYDTCVDNVVDHLSRTGITAIPGERRTPIEEIAATGWGDEFSECEVTLGKVTILDKKDDWDDDERSGEKILVLQEHFSQNQQDFLDEYLPQWDDQLAIQKKKNRNRMGEPIRNEACTSYQPPPDAIIGPTVYPPARQNPQPTYKPDYQFCYPQGRGNAFNGGYDEYHNSQWTLPPAWTELGVMLVLPVDPGLWSNVISRWESITINRLNSQTWSDNKTKLAFMENLLRENEKLMWQQWRTAYPRAYSDLEIIADGLTKHNLIKMCKDAAFAKELRDLFLCSAIPIPGYYKNNRKKYGIRKSRTYKGKLHNSHVKPFKMKYKDDRGRVKKCKCIICGKEGHFAKDCRNFDDSSVYSISEGE